MIKSENHIFAGLQQDYSVSKQQPEYLIDAHNIRITAREGETLLSVTNEKGPKELKLTNSLGQPARIEGTILGHCVLNEYLVLFTHDDSGTDRILRIDMAYTSPVMTTLFSGNLGFSYDYPIETLGDYENNNIQKVYWTDGLNQPRLINIAKEGYTWEGSFDFVPTLQLNENVTVTRVTGAGGMLHSGVIQYAFSYYNKYGQETNLFSVTPLYYISHTDRGASPEDVTSNSFKIEVSNVDRNFEYLRIYSIHRTSLDAVPTCKRVQDIPLDSVSGSKATYIDTGMSGDTVDPSSLLYIGGEEIKAGSLCCKDGTLFLGNLTLSRPNINNIKDFTTNIRSSVAYTASLATNLTSVSTNSQYQYANGLNTQAAGFKNREYYRIGLQAQYKNGKWSEPVFIRDYKVDSTAGPSISQNTLNKLIIKCIISGDRTTELYNAGYRKIRPIVVFPELSDRTVICQGVLNPTMYTSESRNSGSLHAQSSWFFRPYQGTADTADTRYINSSTGFCSPYSYYSYLPYASNSLTWNPSAIRAIEIQGCYDNNHKFQVDWNTLTMHSPDIQFNEQLQYVDLTSIKCRKVGVATVSSTMSDIDIQTSTPTISNGGSGFIHKAGSSYDSKGIISGLFYDDYLVDDYDGGNKFNAYPNEHSSIKWMVYLWNKNGSLNNDINRPASAGTRSSTLNKKTISNLRYATTAWDSAVKEFSMSQSHIPQIFNNNEVAIVKVGDYIYQGNVDTLLAPDNNDGLYFAYGKAATTSNQGTTSVTGKDIVTPFTSTSWWKTWSEQEDAADAQGLYKRVYVSNAWKFERKDKNIADHTPALATNKEAVRMKYKSTPHIVLRANSVYSSLTDPNTLPIVELYRDYNKDTTFGGQTRDAMLNNKWVPAGKEIKLAPGAEATLEYTWGDTWYSRFDCLKTYPFTTEDPNQVVEIGSFMLETRINIDGRYDRNRGQLDNTNMSPLNFNLLNPVYSQMNNFFSYFMVDPDYYKLNRFPNQITWSLEKHPGQDVDSWTTVTLATTYNMDGSKGQIRALRNWKDTIYCFQDDEINTILFNSRVQVQASDGVPIEIANNYKVDGKRCISEGTGCVNEYTICPTPMALYFIDSVSGHLQAISDQGLTDLSLAKNMSSWIGKQSTYQWKPNDYSMMLFYDRNNRDVYIVTEKESLCYNEALGQFVSFMSYDNIPVMFNIVDKFYCIKSNYLNEMFAGDYNYFFDEFQGYDFTFVSNGKSAQQDLSSIDKTYSTMDFRADKWSDKLDSILSSESPFDYVRVWNEYQDTGEVLLKCIPNRPSILKKKFRVWRVQIPRDAHNRTSRIRNTWCKIKLGSAPRYNNGNNSFIQFHDIGVQYIV